MRALILVLLFAGMIFSSCTKEETPFDIVPDYKKLENVLLADEMWDNETTVEIEEREVGRYEEFKGKVDLKLSGRAPYRCPGSEDRLIFLGEGVTIPFGDFQMGLTHCYNGMEVERGRGLFAKNGDIKMFFKYEGKGTRRGDGNIYIVANMTITRGLGIYVDATGSFRFEGTVYTKEDATGKTLWLSGNFYGSVAW
jgi:hypothetical protein